MKYARIQHAGLLQNYIDTGAYPKGYQVFSRRTSAFSIDYALVQHGKRLASVSRPSRLARVVSGSRFARRLVNRFGGAK